MQVLGLNEAIQLKIVTFSLRCNVMRKGNNFETMLSLPLDENFTLVLSQNKHASEINYYEVDNVLIISFFGKIHYNDYNPCDTVTNHFSNLK